MKGDVLACTILALAPLVSAAALAGLIRFSRRADGRRRDAVTWLARIMIPVFLVSAGLAAGEAYFRFFHDASDSYGLSRVARRWFERHWRLNRSGFRDDAEYTIQCAPGRRRITFVGDSFTAGHGLANVRDRFANRLPDGRAYEVHVLAKAGYDTGEMLELLQDLRAQGYGMDEVVLVYVPNDISDIAPGHARMNRRIFARPAGFWVNHSLLFNTLYHRGRARTDPDVAGYYRYVEKAYSGPTWEEQQRRLLALRDLAESQGGRFRVVTFPFVQGLGAGNEFRAVHAKLATFWTGQGVPHLDLLGVFESAPGRRWTVNRYDAHPNAAAHALAAEAIGAFLQTGARPAAPAPSAGPAGPLLQPILTTKERAQRGAAELAQSRFAEAVADWRIALAARPDSAEILNNLAWILATCRDPALRDGAEAILLAERACALATPDEAGFRDTLAAAYAEAGRFDEAIRAAELARDIARHAGDEALAARTEQRLVGYRRGRPWRD
ncbi:MAG TPA: hypothetical protein P5567_04390 [Kiritimatiellia bacterium]|nr:hypothetical protein [Kiritimatiellia bacterium]HRZ11677.1 hypothetical protein [Kiritimatiellia bacterium]HSA16772.1 hypothetical protein [Kiritimatiellia bacterium]